MQCTRSHGGGAVARSWLSQGGGGGAAMVCVVRQRGAETAVSRFRLPPRQGVRGDELRQV